MFVPVRYFQHSLIFGVRPGVSVYILENEREKERKREREKERKREREKERKREREKE